MAEQKAARRSQMSRVDAQFRELRAIIERQQARIDELEQRATAQAEQRATGRGRGHRQAGRSASRRALLKWGGAAAAAAAVTMVASEQSAHAAPAIPANNGDAITAGNTTTTTGETVLQLTGGAPVQVLFVDGSVGGTGTGGIAGKGVQYGVYGEGVSNNVGLWGYAPGASAFGAYAHSDLGVGVYGLTAGTADGVLGASSGGNGVHGTSTNGDGVRGEAGSGAGVGGVHGLAGTNGNGVFGTALGFIGYGVFGTSDSGYGVIGSTATGFDLVSGGNGRIWQVTQLAAGAPTTGSHIKGESVRDLNGDLYLCVADGSPGTWKKVAAIPAGKPGGALVFLPKPFRIFDTRPGVAGCPIDPGVPMPSASVTTLQVTGTPSTIDATLVVPTGATGIIGGLLAINVNGNGISGAGAGFLTLQPHSVTPTGNSYLHYYPATVQHNCVVMGLDASGKLDVGNYNTATNVGLDITGYII
jgi:hypothetical protein